MTSPMILLRGFLLVISCLGVGRELVEESLGEGLLPGHGRVERTFEVELHEITKPIFSALDAAGVEPKFLNLDLGEEQIGVEIEVGNEARTNEILLDFIEFPRQAQVMFPEDHKEGLHTPGPAVAMEYDGVTKDGQKVKIYAMTDPADTKRTILQARIGGDSATKSGKDFLDSITHELVGR